MKNRIKEWMPNTITEKIRMIRRIPNKGEDHKIFCISFQKTGTTSVGDFFQKFGYSTARWHDSDKDDWTKKWYSGDFDSIFNSSFFRLFQVFEDNPWWFPEFYKVLYHRFPTAKFVLFLRPVDDWFESMCKAFHGNSEDVLKIHAKLYRREDEFYRDVESLKDTREKREALIQFMNLNQKAEHYKMLYEMRNREAIEFFEKRKSDRLFVCDLYDEKKWQKLAGFAGFSIPDDFKVHSNKTKEN